MEYIREDQIVLYEELCSRPLKEDHITEATILFRNNIKLAHYISKQFSDPWDNAITEEDILQSCYQGLWTACLNYDASTEFKFSTYAVPIIRGTVLTMFRRSSPIHLPRSLRDIQSCIQKHGYELPLSSEEIDIIAKDLELSRSKVASFLGVSVCSLDTPIPSEDSDNAGQLADIIPGDLDILVELSVDDLEGLIDNILDKLTPRIRPIVEEWLFSIVADDPVTQHELSIKYNKSQPQISRILGEAKRVISKYKAEIIRNI